MDVTAKEVKEIKLAVESGLTNRQIAEKFGLKLSRVKYILHAKISYKRDRKGSHSSSIATRLGKPKCLTCNQVVKLPCAACRARAWKQSQRAIADSRASGRAAT